MEEGSLERTESCVRFDKDLMASLEGETQPFVSAHVQECEFCRVVLADLEQVRLASWQFLAEAPSPAVWANIRARLNQEGIIREKQTGWSWLGKWSSFHRLAPLGAMACLVILGSALMAPRTPFEKELPPGPLPPRAPVALQDLENTFKANEKFLAPEVREAYDKSLLSLDDSISECWSSLQQEPSDSLAHEYLLAAYSRKAEVLTSALEFAGQ
jgi:hypothetical protein